MRLGYLRILTWMELKRIWNDKRELLVSVFGAILLSLVFGFVAHHNPKEIDVNLFVDQFQNTSSYRHEETQQIMADIDKSAVFSVSEAFSLRDAMQRLSDRNSRAVIVLIEGATGLKAVRVTMDATDATIQQAISKELLPIIETNSRQASIELLSTTGLSNQQATQLMKPLNIHMKTNESQEIRYFDSFASPLIILIVLGISLLTAVTAVTSERSTGTMERVFASPYRSSEIILSKILARSVLGIVVSIMVILTLKLVFGIALASPLLVLIITVLVCINGLVFGLLVSSVTYVELESVAMGIAFFLLFMTLMGFMWPLETMHPVFRFVSSLTPYLHAVHAIRHTSLAGWGLAQVWPDLAILCGFIVAQVLVATQLLKREVR